MSSLEMARELLIGMADGEQSAKAGSRESADRCHSDGEPAQPRIRAARNCSASESSRELTADPSSCAIFREAEKRLKVGRVVE